MRIHTKLTYDWSGDAAVLVSEEGYEYGGPVCELKGPSKEEKELQKTQTALGKEQVEFSQQQREFYDVMMKNYAQQFENQTAILKSINEAWLPVLEAGAGQEGFTPEQKTALQTQMMEETGASYRKAQQAVGESLAARGGVPSGTDESLRAEIATAGAADVASKQTALTQANYERGYQKWLNAANILGGTAAQYNPTGYSQSATGAAAGAAGTYQGASSTYASAFDMAKTIKEQSGGFWGAVGGVLGGAAQGFGEGFGTALGGTVCWVAEAIYGPGSPEFWAAWRFINERWTGRAADYVRAVYRRYGQRLAYYVRRSRVLRAVLKPLFDVAVRRGV